MVPAQAIRNVEFVSPQWVHERLGSQEVLIIDSQPNIYDYLTEHVPNAVYLNENVWRCPHGTSPVSYCPTNSMEHILSRAGLRHGTPVVVYSDRGRFTRSGDGLEPTMTAYSLVRFGHEKVYILDGGLDVWKRSRLPLTKDYPKARESEYHCTIRHDLYVEYDEFRAIKDRDDVQLFDVRPPSVYEQGGVWAKPGHIPGAVSLPWRHFMDQHNPYLLRPENELIEYVKNRGADTQKTIILYCGTGREATDAFIVFKYVLGFPSVRLYEGSFTEWISHPENDTVSGNSPYAESESVATR